MNVQAHMQVLVETRVQPRPLSCLPALEYPVAWDINPGVSLGSAVCPLWSGMTGHHPSTFFRHVNPDDTYSTPLEA